MSGCCEQRICPCNHQPPRSPRHFGKPLRGMVRSPLGLGAALPTATSSSVLQQVAAGFSSIHLATIDQILLALFVPRRLILYRRRVVVPPASVQAFLSLSLLFRSPAAHNFARRLAKTTPMSLVPLNHRAGTQSVDLLYRQFSKRQETGLCHTRCGQALPLAGPSSLHHQQSHRHLPRMCLMAVSQSANTRMVTSVWTGP
ncbi:hypothetical protein IWX90DRAFT_129448 [Phyllosticta citrichinensis]|uniref:Uncharacterized protein n=1 Tax=Phyllosticta citrichinensis TaxID=1130410 RepID=A0ABR1Y4E3_9PEZI